MTAAIAEPDARAAGLAEVDAISAWIVEQGLLGQDLRALLSGLAERLVEAGVPLVRAHLSFPTIHPQMRGANLVWIRGAGAVRETVPHEVFEDVYEASPFPDMLARGLTTRRWRLTDRASAGGFGPIEQAWRLGATEVVVHLVPFHGAAALPGIATSFATERPGGFTAHEHATLAALSRPLGLAAYRLTTADVLGAILDAYVGVEAGHRVMRGEVRRGVGETLNGVILFSDLRGFTAAAETGGQAFIARLDEHLEAMAAPIEAHGGEILKFLGDGLLAGFQLDPAAPEGSAARALAAALDAVRRNAAVNARFPGTQALGLDVALHCGDVFYGNIGGGSRLDFTVIGPAVNEASRIEGLCGALDRSILMSRDFAALCGQPVVSLGLHRLRGVAEPREIFGLDEG